MAHLRHVLVDVIVKLGGSAITVKDELERPKQEEIRRAVEIIAQCHKQGNSCVVVHGAGSFGHHHAKEYSVRQGYKDLSPARQNRVREGFCKTRQSVTKLNHLLIEELTAVGLPVVSVSPCSSWVTEYGQVVEDDVDGVSRLLVAGFIPLLHGDCVIDLKKGCHILSGDTIIQVLSQKLRAPYIVFLTDVQGIYDQPPSNTEAKLIPKITVNSRGEIGIPVKTSIHPKDVSGGIEFKISTASAIVAECKGSTQVYICDINSEEALHACVQGDYSGHQGTLILYKDTK